MTKKRRSSSSRPVSAMALVNAIISRRSFELGLVLPRRSIPQDLPGRAEVAMALAVQLCSGLYGYGSGKASSRCMT